MGFDVSQGVGFAAPVMGLASGQGVLGGVRKNLFGETKSGGIDKKTQARYKNLSTRITEAGLTGLQQDQAFLDRRNALASALQESALGTGGPSVAENMLRQQSDLDQRRMLAASLAAPGVNPALALRAANTAAAMNAAQTSGNAATLRAQEQLESRGALLSALSQEDEEEFRRQMALNQIRSQDFERRYGVVTGAAAAKQAANQMETQQNMAILSGGAQAAASVAGKPG